MDTMGLILAIFSAVSLITAGILGFLKLKSDIDALRRNPDDTVSLAKAMREELEAVRLTMTGIRADLDSQGLKLTSLEEYAETRLTALNGRITGVQRGNTRSRKKQINDLKDQLAIQAIKQIHGISDTPDNAIFEPE